MSAFGIAASHTPLKDFKDPAPGVRETVDACFARLRAEVAAFAPTLVLAFGPDHFNGFFYRLMPSFCIGAVAESVGDWATPAGPLPGNPALAEAAVAFAQAAGVDLAISHRMEVDHGHTQLLHLLFDWATMPPVLPVFVNCVGTPRPPLARVAALGRALGAFVGGLDERVLVLGSGGISHDPPVPALNGAPPEVRERLIAGGGLSAEARAARQARVVDEANRQVAGTGTGVPLNPVWDRKFLAALEQQDFAALTACSDEEISRDGGRGGHEIRCWIAAAAAMQALAAPAPRVLLYHTIPEWVAGFAVASQGPV